MKSFHRALKILVENEVQPKDIISLVLSIHNYKLAKISYDNSPTMTSREVRWKNLVDCHYSVMDDLRKYNLEATFTPDSLIEE